MCAKASAHAAARPMDPLYNNWYWGSSPARMRARTRAVYGVRKDSAMKPIWLWMSVFHAWAWCGSSRMLHVRAAAAAAVRVVLREKEDRGRDLDLSLDVPIVIDVV